MLSKNQIKLITSLQKKKYRNKHKLFVVEGVKVVNEFLKSNFVLDSIFCTETFFNDLCDENAQNISLIELKKISALKNPNEVLALFKIPKVKDIKKLKFTLVLDAINDPGNLGTIIRLCDWFGITQIICSQDTVDCYNPKVVQATMGSLTRMSIIYTDVLLYLKKNELPIYAAVMNGENIYTSNLKKDAVLVMGNEANGIRDEIIELITDYITIPRFGKIQEAESLNVATATAILLSEFYREVK